MRRMLCVGLGALALVALAAGCPREPAGGAGGEPAPGKVAARPDGGARPVEAKAPPRADGGPLEAPPAADPPEGGPTTTAGDSPDEGDVVTDEEISNATPELFEADGIRLTALVLAPAVEDRQPVEPRTTFSRSSDDRVYCYLRLDNPGGRATTLHVTWERTDGSSSRAAAPLNVPALSQYRTWTWGGTRFPTGRYRAVVRTAEGSVLGRLEYDLTD